MKSAAAAGSALADLGFERLGRVVAERELARIGGGAPHAYLPWMAIMAVLLVCANMAVLTLAAWPRLAKPLWLALTIGAAVGQHYMLSYRVVMDPGMLSNVLATDAGEVLALLSGPLALQLLLVAPVAWLLGKVRNASRSTGTSPLDIR